MTQQAIIKTDEFMASAARSQTDTLISEGDFTEARRVLAEAIIHVGDDLDERVALLNSLCKVERAAGRVDEALRIHLEAYPLSQLCRHPILRFKFHNGLGITYRLNGELDKSLIEYEAARFHAEEAGDFESAGYVENNIAVILCDLSRTDEAREHLLKARTYFTQPVKQAEIDLTEAQVALQEEKPLEALSCVVEAVRTFISHGETKLLNDSIPTLLKAAADYRFECSRALKSGDSFE